MTDTIHNRPKVLEIALRKAIEKARASANLPMNQWQKKFREAMQMAECVADELEEMARE